MSSDDSDFYGDDDTVADLHSRVKEFDVPAWWANFSLIQTPLKMQAQCQAQDNQPHLHNPYAGVPYAWQLSETVDDFLARLPPATTDQTPELPWIYICNPYIDRKRKADARNQQIRGGEDEAPEEANTDVPRFVQGGMERLYFVTEFLEELRKSGQNPTRNQQQLAAAGQDAARDILELAHNLYWMLFCSIDQVDEMWRLIAHATANNELGIAAKVAPRSQGDQRTERLICVYTANFADTNDVRRVAERLKKLGLVAAHSRPLYYKPDAYTYLGISSGNAWGVKPSIYNTAGMFGNG